jgi:hypothetical protein
VGRIGRYEPDLQGSRRTELVEEAGHDRLVAAWGGPHQPAGVVIDHHRQVPVPFAIRDLVDPDPCQPLERIETRACVV